MANAERPAGEALRVPHYELIVNEELEGFDSVEVRKAEELYDGFRRPLTVDVHFPDGSTIEGVPANYPVFTLRPQGSQHGVDVVLGIERAHHVQDLHIRGSDSGSAFFEGSTLKSVLQDVGNMLPLRMAEDSYVSEATSLNMGCPYGWKNLFSLVELEQEGRITAAEAGVVADRWRDISDQNRHGTLESKREYVEWFNESFEGIGLFLKIIRPPHHVIVPHMVGEPRTTSNVVVALSSRYGEGHKKIHTITPGIMLSRHPIPGEHFDRARREISESSFIRAAWNWTHHVLVVPPAEQGEEIA